MTAPVPFSGGGAWWSEPAALPFPAFPTTGAIPAAGTAPNGGIPKGKSPAPLATPLAAPSPAPAAAVVVRTSLELLDLRMGGSPLLLLPASPAPPRPFCPALAAAAWWASVAAMGRAERVSGAGEETLVETAAWRAMREGSCSFVSFYYSLEIDILGYNGNAMQSGVAQEGGGRVYHLARLPGYPNLTAH